jgi:hypothetical protein
MSTTGHLPAEAGDPERGLQPAAPATPLSGDAAPLTVEDATLLDRIARAARDVRAVKAAFKKNPAPELAELIKVLSTLTFHVAEKANNDASLLSTTNALMKTIIEAGRLSAKEADTRLAERKWQFNATKACMAKLTELKYIAADSDLTDEEKIDLARLELFGEVVD